MPTRRVLLRGVGGCLCAGMAGLSGCSDGVEGVELTQILVETLTVGVSVTAHYANATNEEVTADVTVELAVGEGEDADSYEATERSTLPPGRNSSVEVLFSDDALLGGTDQRIDATVRTAFPESDTDPPPPSSCEDCTG